MSTLPGLVIELTALAESGGRTCPSCGEQVTVEGMTYVQVNSVLVVRGHHGDVGCGAQVADGDYPDSEVELINVGLLNGAADLLDRMAAQVHSR